MSTTCADVLILGGGPAGLALGWALRDTGLSYLILEGASIYGGNARTIVHGDFRFDTGPHRFHDRDVKTTARVIRLLGNQFHEVNSPSRIYWNNRFIDFPLRPVKALTCGSLSHGIKSVADFIRTKLQGSPQADNFGTWACNTFGNTLARTFLIPFSEKLWGMPAQELSPAIAGRRLPGFSFWTILRELFFPDKRPRHLEGRFLYPNLGYGQIVEAMASNLLPACLRLGCRVTRIAARNNAVSEVACQMPEGQGLFTGSFVVNTLPMTAFCRMLTPTPAPDILSAASRLRFRNVVLAVLFLDMESVSDAACIYFPDQRFPFSRIHEPRNRSVAMGPSGKTSLVAEYPCFEDDKIWQTDRDTLIKALTDDLATMGIIAKDRVLGHQVVRLRHAYPVYAKGYETHVGAMGKYLSRYENLRMLGRAGAFFYGHVHDFIGSAFKLAQDLVEAKKKRASNISCNP